MSRNITYALLYGNTNKNLRVDCIFKLDIDGQYQTIKDVSKTTTKIRPTYSLSISEGFNQYNMFVPTQRYWSFIDVFIKSVKSISSSIHDIFPNMQLNEFDIDQKALEIYKTEKAMMVNGYTVLPCIWVDETSGCHAAVSITDIKSNMVRIPFDDAVLLSLILKRFDPINYQLSCMNLIGGIR